MEEKWIRYSPWLERNWWLQSRQQIETLARVELDWKKLPAWSRRVHEHLLGGYQWDMVDEAIKEQ